MKAGDIIDARHRLERKIGQGGLAEVWLAWQTTIDRRVAIKFLKGLPSENDLKRFQSEARALGRLDHPHCVTVFDFGHHDGKPYLVMEFLEGVPLSKHRGTKLPVDRVVSITRDVLGALSHAHSLGIVHRDLKPENVFLAQTPAGEVVKVLDFGLAKVHNPGADGRTATGEFGGTAPYMSPEQLRGLRDAGPATDLYALGVMMFELLEGRLPFEASSLVDWALKHRLEPPPPITRPDCPPELAALVSKLLEKDASARYSSADAVLQALDDAPARSRARVFALAALVAALVVGVIGLVAWQQLGQRSTTPPRPPDVPDATTTTDTYVAPPRAGPCLGTGDVAWQIHRGDRLAEFGSEIDPEDDDRAFEHSSIPAEDSAGWSAHEHEDVLFHTGSPMCGPNRPDLPCRTGGAFVYLQTFFDLPTDTPAESLDVWLDELDDAARVTLYNSAHPQGIVTRFTRTRLRAHTADFASHLAPGRNRVVITHLDDCCGMRTLRGVRLQLNGEIVRGCAATPTPCGTDPGFRGTQTRTSTIDGTTRRWKLHVPTDYTPNLPHPVIVLFSEDGVPGPTWVEDSQLKRDADLPALIVVEPEGFSDPDLVLGVVEQVQRELCIDRFRLYAMGHGKGGTAAATLACQPWVQGLALTSSREVACPAIRAVPTILTSPLDSPRLPAAGGHSCEEGRGLVTSIAQFEEAWRGQNQCEPASQQIEEGGGTSFVFDACAGRFRSCHVNGGYGWPHTPPSECNGPPPTFPLGHHIRAFFNMHWALPITESAAE